MKKIRKITSLFLSLALLLALMPGMAWATETEVIAVTEETATVADEAQEPSAEPAVVSDETEDNEVSGAEEAAEDEIAAVSEEAVEDEIAAVSEEDIATVSDVVDSGKCGDNLTWSLDSSGTLTISGSGAMYDYDGFGNEAPWDDYTVSSLTIGSSVTSIGEHAFAGCDLKSVVIPDSVTSIGDAAFEYCQSLTSVTFGSSVKTIGYAAFCFCESLKSVTFPDSLTTIGDDAFWYCSSLSSVKLGSGVTTIGNYAFTNCAFTSATIPASVKSIGTMAFGFLHGGEAYIDEDKGWPDFTYWEGTYYEDDGSYVIIEIDEEEGGGMVATLDGFTIKGYSGSAAETYAKEWGLNFVSLNSSSSEVSAPTMSSITNTASGVKITWNAVTGATKYNVYRKALGDTSWTKVGTSTSTSYTSTGVSSGKTYTFTVQAVNSSGTTSSYGSSTKTIKYLSEVTLTVQNKPGGTRLNWTKSTGASGGYYVYRRTVGGSYTKIASIASGTLTYLDSTAVSGTQYYYAVRAVSSGYLSSYTSKGIVRLDHPTLTLSNASTGVKLTWTKSANCSGYNIYRKTSSGSYTKIKVVTGASNLTWTDTTAESGVTYTYYVCAYKGSSISSYTSKTIKYLSEVTLTVQNKPGGTRLTWTKSTGASGGYYIYRKTASGSYSKIASVASGTLTYLDSTAVSGTQYYYAVRAVSSGYLSSYTAKTIVRLSHPTLTLSSASTGVKLTWTKVANCSGYNIYRKSGTGSYTKINVVTGASNLTWTDTSAKSGVTYTYYVCAYKGSSTSSYTSKSITLSTSSTVYVTETGTKYHVSGCSYLSESKIAMSLSDAKAAGYTACSVCNPPA